MDAASLGLLFLLLLVLFREPLFQDRVMLSFDTRLWPPFSAHASEGLERERMNMIHGDLPCWMMPERLVTTEMLKKGTSPLWTPYTIGGMPLLAQLAYPVYYPVNLLLCRVLGMDPLKALGFQTFINLAVAGLGMYLFLRILSLSRPSCLLGAMALSCSAWYLTHVYIPIFVNSAAWIPLMFWAGEHMVRKRPFGVHAFLMSVFVGFSLLGGFPQTTIIGLYGVGIWMALRILFNRDLDKAGWKAKLSPMAVFALAAGLGIGLSMIELLPAAEFKANSLRDQDYPLSYYKETVLEPPSLIEALAPGFFGHPVDPEGGGGRHGDVREFLPFRLFLSYHVQNNFMENALYVGVLPLLFALSALGALRRSPAWILLLLAAFALLIACGTPLLDFSYYCLPGLRVGHPKRLLLLFAFAFSALAAFGMDRLFSETERPPQWFGTAAAIGSGVMLALAVTVFYPGLSDAISRWWADRAASLQARDPSYRIPSHEESIQALAYLRRILWTPAIVLILFGFIRIFRSLKPSRLLFPSLVVAFAAMELFLFGEGFITSQAGGVQYPKTEITEYMKREADETNPVRVAAYGRDELLMPNLTAIHGIQCLGGVSGLVHRRFGEYVHALDPSLINMEDPRFVGALKNPESLASPLLDLAGIGFLAVGSQDHAKDLEEHGFTLAYPSDGSFPEHMALYRNPGVTPRAFIVTSFVKRTAGEALALIQSPDFKPLGKVVLEEEPPEGFAPFAAPGGKSPEVKILEYAPQTIRIQADMDASRGFLVLTDIHYPGWSARVNGVDTPILRADYAFRAVPLRQGLQTVEFVYQPGSRKYGTLSTCLSLILLLLWGLLLLKSKMKRLRDTHQC